MKITYIQTRLQWEDRTKNLQHFAQLMSEVPADSQLILLPEMFSTGFTMRPEELAEEANTLSLDWMREQAAKKNAVLCGSISVKDKGTFYNRLYWVSPDGAYRSYDKRHLFRMAGEDKHYTAGTERLITEIGDWKFCPLVCYDLRFPVWSRNRFRVKKPAEGSGQQEQGAWEYDVLIFVANWPEARVYAWKHLLIARAIENQCYVIGVNRVGEDGKGIPHSGDSIVIDPYGKIISSLEPGKEAVQSLVLDRQLLEDFRARFPVGLDADEFTLL